jgi:hypothetical protein
MNMMFPDRRTLNVLMTALLFGLVLAIVYVARAVIVILSYSILFAYLINPIVRFLQRHSLFFRNLRGPHAAEAHLALLIFLGLIIHNLAPQLVPGVMQLVRDSPDSVHLGNKWTLCSPTGRNTDGLPGNRLLSPSLLGRHAVCGPTHLLGIRPEMRDQRIERGTPHKLASTVAFFQNSPSVMPPLQYH